MFEFQRQVFGFFPMIRRDPLAGGSVQMRKAMLGLRFAVQIWPLVDGDLVALRWQCTRNHHAARTDFAGTKILRVENG